MGDILVSFYSGQGWPGIKAHQRMAKAHTHVKMGLVKSDLFVQIRLLYSFNLFVKIRLEWLVW
jgi:uncharacterized protein YktB (UPF0637 family)